jgi:dual specificity phosphatase 12
VIAYLMHRDGLDFDSALDAVRKKRPQARPNEGFRRQLIQLSKK